MAPDESDAAPYAAVGGERTWGETIGGSAASRGLLRGAAVAPGGPGGGGARIIVAPHEEPAACGGARRLQPVCESDVAAAVGRSSG